MLGGPSERYEKKLVLLQLHHRAPSAYLCSRRLSTLSGKYWEREDLARTRGHGFGGKKMRGTRRHIEFGRGDIIGTGGHNGEERAKGEERLKGKAVWDAGGGRG